MAPAKQKAQKMSIGTFLTDENYGSWADEMDDMPLPAPPVQAGRPGGPPAGFGNGLDRDRGGFAIREPLPLPTQPPYTAHIGNLSFDATSSDIGDLFSGCGVTNVRIVEDKLTKAPKGFGYVEFETVDGLKKALDMSGATLQGRSVRVSIAEPPKDREVKEFDWTRRGPLPDLPSRRVPDRAGFGRGLDAASDAGSDRGGRRMESDVKPRDFGNWERKGPLSPVGGGPVREGDRPVSSEGPGFRRSSPAWGEGRSQEGSQPPRRDLHAPTAAELDTEWRARMRPDHPSPATKEPSNPPSPASSTAAPATRPKLNLQKRSVPDAVLSPAPSTTESKASPFGGARPIDTAAREREVEERRQLAIRQKRETDEKAKAEKSDKQRQAKDQAKGAKAAVDSDGKDGVDTSQGGKSFEILRRAVEDESGMTADREPEEQAGPAAEAKGAKTTAPNEPSSANGAWRNKPADSAEAADDEGWSTVGSRQRSNRRGQAGRTLA